MATACEEALTGERLGLTTTRTSAGSFSFGTTRLRLFRFRVTAPVRVYLTITVQSSYEEVFTFDVFSTETLTLPCDSYKLELQALSTADVRWVVVETDRFFPAELSYNILFAAGAYDSSADTTLRPPSGARFIRIHPRDTGDFTVEILESSTVVTTATRDDQPSQGVSLGIADRITLVAGGAVRVEFIIKV